MYDKFRCCLLGRLFYCETEEIYEVKPVFGTKSDIPAAGSSLGRPRRHFTFRHILSYYYIECHMQIHLLNHLVNIQKCYVAEASIHKSYMLDKI